MQALNVAELIAKKREGQQLSAEEIRWLVPAYSEGLVPDYQMSALAMAIFFRGLHPEELAAWTDAMMHSGEVVDLSGIEGPKVDKHSTGGVGDKVSLCLAPLVAACGLYVPMVSGRGLGHTGGTLDKLEAIPGFRVDLTIDHFVQQVNEIRVCMMGQTETLNPADRKLYALRDVTGTVPSQELICASIMSKKLAEGIDGLVLDVKVGSGAFMKSLADARRLARMMIGIGERLGKTVRALCTDMSQPLGRWVGNALESREAIEVLRGHGPPDLVELTLELGAEMLLVGGLVPDVQAGRSLLAQAIADGSGLEKMRQMVAHQHGDPAAVDDFSLFPKAREQEDLLAPRSGVLASVDTDQIGWAGMELGAGREAVGAKIDPAVGMEIHARIGQEVRAGEPLLAVHYNDPLRLARAMARLRTAFGIRDQLEEEPPRLVLDRLGG